MYIPNRLSITGAKILRYFDATKYFSVKMTQITIFFEYSQLKSADLFLFGSNVVSIKARVPTPHEQVPLSYEKK